MYGAYIERGKVLEKTSSGYKVQSLTRDGITTPPIPATGNSEYTADDAVYFFLFNDGRGAILAKIEQ